MMQEEQRKQRVVQCKDVVEIFKDPDTEKQVEGFAYVWEVYHKDDAFYQLIVTFMGDPSGRRVMRDYRKYTPN